jgi:NAD(P)-dependent dehydrogenase (short-subunit alcohol dehydrogenase family)
LSLGAKVVGGDLAEPPESSSDNFTFLKTNVAEWQDQVRLFKETLKLHGHIDHVYANAGVGTRTNYVDGIELDENGDPKEPTSFVLDVNLKGVIHTATLAVHYLRREDGGQGRSIVINASVTGLARFRAVDYCTNAPVLSTLP